VASSCAATPFLTSGKRRGSAGRKGTRNRHWKKFARLTPVGPQGAGRLVTTRRIHQQQCAASALLRSKLASAQLAPIRISGSAVGDGSGRMGARRSAAAIGDGMGRTDSRRGDGVGTPSAQPHTTRECACTAWVGVGAGGMGAAEFLDDHRLAGLFGWKPTHSRLGPCVGFVSARIQGFPADSAPLDCSR